MRKMREKKGSKNQLVLLEDITNLGKKGDLVYAKPGFIRNFLLPQKKAILADKRTIRMQKRLKEERAKQAALDKKDAQILAERLRNIKISVVLKTDKQGHLYGSISAQNIVKFLEEEGITVDKKNVLLPRPIKSLGLFDIQLNLKENIPATFKLEIKGDRVLEEVNKHIKVVEEEKNSAPPLKEGVPEKE